VLVLKHIGVDRRIFLRFARLEEMRALGRSLEIPQISPGRACFRGEHGVELQQVSTFEIRCKKPTQCPS